MNNDLSQIYEQIRADGSIVINKNLIFSLGMKEAIIYTELIAKHIYFSNKESITEDGYFFNTVDNLLIDTGLREKAQRSAINNLQDFGLIEYKLKDTPPKRYFKIVDNTQLLLKYIEIGREKRELLEENLLQSTANSKLRLTGGINNSQTQESITPNGRVNNTNPNNTNLNNTKEYYIAPSDDIYFLAIYFRIFEEIFGCEHMKIKQSNYIELETWIDDLIEYGVDDDYWEDEILEHFDNLPAKNNGNILAFMAASIRHFEVDSPGHSRF